MSTSTPNQRHDQIVERIRSRVELAREAGEKPRITHGGSTRSTRMEEFEHTIDVGDLDSVLSIDTGAKTVTVEPNVSMRELVDATLEEGLVPPVVPEFPEITVGGAIQGAGGESGSFQYGGFHTLATSAEYVLGDATVVEASAEENEDIFYGAPCSCGSLGIITRATLELVEAEPYVKVEYRDVHSTDEMVSGIEEAVEEESADFVDGIMFEPSYGAVLVGELSPDDPSLPKRTIANATDDWFYKQAERRAVHVGTPADLIPIRDDLFRYDRGAFWTGKYVFHRVGVPYTRVSRTLMDPFFHTAPMYHALHATDMSFDFVIQDICMPVETVREFVDWIDENLGVYPLWYCPVKKEDEEKAFLSPAAIDTEIAVNVGVWGPVPEGEEFYEVNRELERVATDLGGRKILYSQQFYPEGEFWEKFDADRYQRLRERCDAEDVFDDMWQKTHVGDDAEASVRKAWFEVLAAPFRV
ncbi:MAG: FAD-binding protein [Bradymonadaceae bacterium]